MGGCRLVVAGSIVSALLAGPVLHAQQAPATDQIKQQLDKIKKGFTLQIPAAPGTDDSNGATLLRVDNTSPFKLIVLIVGPTTQRIELDGDRMQTLTVEPGDYEIAVTVVGRDVPPFYGKQKIEPHKFFRQKFVVPVV